MKSYALKTVILAILIMPLMACAGNDPKFNQDTLIIKTQDDKRYQLKVELALTQAQKNKGLMNRQSLDFDKGMLFWFGKEGERTFWMKNTLIPLDMIFIAKDGTINHIHGNARPLDETRITSPKPAIAVLEINGGQAYKWGIETGDKILHPMFPNSLAE